MNRAALITLALALAVTFVGCSSPATETEKPTTPAASEAEPEPTATAEAAPLVLCEIISQKLLDYPDYVLAVANGEFDQATHDEYLGWAEEMEAAAPAGASVPLAKFTDPIHQVQEVVEAGGGSLSFSTVDYKAGTVEIMEYCVDAGFKVDN